MAKLPNFHYGNAIIDNYLLCQCKNFDDSLIYSELLKNVKKRRIPMVQMMRDKALKAFELWNKKADKVKY